MSHVSVMATHLSLVDRTRHRQVQSLLEHPQLASGAAILLGDMNAWRNCKASRTLEEEISGVRMTWPRTFPAARPVLALDRIYSRGARIESIEAHTSPAAKKASDHLPIVARVELTNGEGTP